MSNRALDRAMYEDYVRGEIACCECGFHRNGKHHPKIRCPKTGRCGDCGNPWPCEEHAPKKDELAEKQAREIFGAVVRGEIDP